MLNYQRVKHLELRKIRCAAHGSHALVLDQEMALSSTRGLGGTVTRSARRLAKTRDVGQLIPWEIIGSFYNIEICSSENF
jgi:hypothetical protein